MRGPRFAYLKDMSPIEIKPHRKSGDYVRASIVPANVVTEPHFGLLDVVLVVLFLACAGGVIYWILG